MAKKVFCSKQMAKCMFIRKENSGKMPWPVPEVSLHEVRC